MISPITARAKTIFQMVCKEKLNWDSDLPVEITKIWAQLLDALGVLKFDRFSFVDTHDSLKQVELHGFCDSSALVYCAVVYLRVITDNGIKVFFLS